LLAAERHRGSSAPDLLLTFEHDDLGIRKVLAKPPSGE